MKLSPLDIQHMEFERSVSGYKRTQVRSFLERVASEREDLLKELQGLRDKVSERDARIASLQEAETDLRQAVIAAERVANQIKENARQEAALMLREAESGMRDARADAEAGVRRSRAELVRLENLKDSFREQFRGMLQAFERSLETRSDMIGSEDLAEDSSSDAAAPTPSRRAVDDSAAPLAEIGAEDLRSG